MPETLFERMSKIARLSALDRQIDEAEEEYRRSRNAMDASSFGGRNRTAQALAKLNNLREQRTPK